VNAKILAAALNPEDLNLQKRSSFVRNVRQILLRGYKVSYPIIHFYPVVRTSYLTDTFYTFGNVKASPCFLLASSIF